MGTPDDAALGLPLVMTGSDATRTLDRIVRLGCLLEEGECGWWRVRCGTVAWHSVARGWFKIEDGSTGYTYVSKQQAIEEFANAPDPHNGTTPGQQPSRTDAASLSDLVSRREACRVVESAAWNALLDSGLTREQFVLLGAYNDSIHATRKAELDMHYTMFAKGGSL